MTISISTLFSVATAEAILDLGLSVARGVGLDTTSWRAGDPTRALFKFVAEILSAFETYAAQYARSGFLSTSEDDWKTLVAKEVHGVDRPAATYATSTITLANAGGGWYDPAAGDFTVSSSLSGVTYHTTAAFSLHGVGSTTVVVEADEPGSAGSAGANEIDTVVTTLLGVSITASTAAVGVDAASDAELDVLCAAALGGLSPNGPAEAYDAVALDSDLTGTTEITRCQASADSPTGAVSVWIATATGAPSGAAVTLVQAAIDVWATPLCITPTVHAATEDSTACTATISGDDIPADGEDTCEDAYVVLLATIAIGGLVSRSAIIAAMHNALVAAGARNVSVALTVPAADVQLAAGHVAVAGAISITEV